MRAPASAPWRDSASGHFTTRAKLSGDSTVTGKPIASRYFSVFTEGKYAGYSVNNSDIPRHYKDTHAYSRHKVVKYRVQGLENEHKARAILEREARLHPKARISYSVGVGKGKDREWVGSKILSPGRAAMRFRVWHRSPSGQRVFRQAEDMTFERKRNKRSVIWYEITVRYEDNT